MGFLLCWQQNKSSSIYRYSASVPTDDLRISFGICDQLSIFNQQLYRAEVTRTTSTAESPGRYVPFKMNFLQKIFRGKTLFTPTDNVVANTRTVEQIQEDANRLWALLRETVEYYKTLACPCAFPRFVQYTSIDCRETHNSFYMSETEGFIQTSSDCFEGKEMDKGDECYKAIYTCKTCGSTYINAWSDFSIRVSRTYLKLIELKAKQIGADPDHPIPFFVGLFGHSYPNRADFKDVDFDTFRNYIRALKHGT